MRKKILLLILSFFAFIPTSYAAKMINTENVDISINADGDALVSEVWTVQKQTINNLEKDFRLDDGVTISDINISTTNGIVYKEVDKFVNGENTFNLSNDNKHYVLKFYTSGEQTTYIITYKINKFVALYNDTLGIDWYLVSRNKSQTITSLSVTVKGPQVFEEASTKLYILGSTDKINYKFENGAITIFATDLKIKNQVRIISLFNTTDFTSSRKVDMSFEDAYTKAKNTNEFFEELSESISPSIIKFTCIIIGILILIAVISKIFKKTKKYNEYSGIKSANGVNKILMENVNYCETIPCNGDLYKISFLAGYYKISKNRSDLIGAYLLKWIYEGKAVLCYDREKPYIKLMQNQYFERKLDLDLYEMIVDASSNHQIDNNKLQRYAVTHYLRVMTWFNMGFNESINDDFSRGLIQKNKKNTILTDKEFAISVDIMGLKKYLLNFNQVPRKTELTEEGYKYLLIVAELLGIGESVAREILRKNPENYMATQLLELENNKYIYKNVYQTALAPYKELTKNRKIKTSYDPELDNLLKQKDKQDNRVSKI